jgi:hypothetical protein
MPFFEAFKFGNQFLPLLRGKGIEELARGCWAYGCHARIILDT